MNVTYCDRCKGEMGKRLVAVEYEGFRIRWNNPTALDTGKRVDLCGGCIRDCMAQGEPAPYIRNRA